MIMDKANLHSFLQLGYFLDYDNPNYKFDFSGINKEKYAEASLTELVNEGGRLWLEAISANFNSNDKHLVPISGGLDSRAILAGLLKHTEAKNIYTYTFGTPKTLDYEIGNYIAKKLGTKHTSYDLTKHIYSQEELEDISKRVDRQTILFHHPPVHKIMGDYAEFQLWNGFLGDSLSGDKILNEPSIDKQSAIQNFINKNKYTRSINLDDLLNIDHYLLDEIKINLTMDEIYDFKNRQLKFIAPHVLMNGFDYKLPFLEKSFFDFMLSAPNKYRFNQFLYKEILLKFFPKEFSYKTKTNFGLPLKATKQRVFVKRVQDKISRTIGLGAPVNINYLDFNKKIREKEDLRKIISNNILDLKQRNIVDWIDIERILTTHLSGKGNHADALIVLASLEIHLKTGLKL